MRRGGSLTDARRSFAVMRDEPRFDFLLPLRGVVARKAGEEWYACRRAARGALCDAAGARRARPKPRTKSGGSSGAAAAATTDAGGAGSAISAAGERTQGAVATGMAVGRAVVAEEAAERARAAHTAALLASLDEEGEEEE